MFTLDFNERQRYAGIILWIKRGPKLLSEEKIQKPLVCKYAK